jgi:hypothetical protein
MSSTGANTGGTAAESLAVSMSVPDSTVCPYGMLVAVVSIVNPSGSVPNLETTTGATWDVNPPGSATAMTYQNSSSTSSSPSEGVHLRTEVWTLPVPDSGSGTLTLDLAGSSSARMSGGGVVLCGVDAISQGVTVANSIADNKVVQATTDASGYMFIDNCAIYGNRTATKRRVQQTLNWNEATGSSTDDVRSVSSRVAMVGEDLTYGYNFDSAILYACSAISMTPQAFTSVGLERFGAKAFDNGVALNWQAGQEAENLGYRLFREDAGKRVLVTPELIAGSALSYPGSPLQAGYSYGWWDPEGQSTSQYWLEDIELGGRETLRGPFAAVPAVGEKSPVERRLSTPLSRVGDVQGLAARRTSGAHGQRVVLDRPSLQIAEAALERQRTLAAGAAAKIVVAEEGWYRVSAEELAGALPGVIGSDPELLQLFVNGTEQAIRVADGADRTFDAGDSVEFYGIPLDTQYSGTQTYWLIKGSERGERIPIRGPFPKPGNRVTTSYSVEQKERLFYAGGVLNGEAENFFGKVVATSPAVMNVSLSGVDRGSTQASALEVAVQGFSDVAHEVTVSLNGTAVGSIPFTGKGWKVAAIPLAAGGLLEGSNTVQVAETGNPKAVSAVGYLRVTYPRVSRAQNDLLHLSLDSTEVDGPVQMSGFSTSAIRIFDVTDPSRVTQVRGAVGVARVGGVPAGGDGYSVSIPQQDLRSVGMAGVRHFVAFTDKAILHPVEVVANGPSTWSSRRNEADYVAIAHASLIPALAELRAVREAQGLKMAVVDVEDVYDEFGFGVKSPEAVRSFVQTAVGTWGVIPRFVLLVGDGSQDPRDYLGLGSDLVPTKLVDTEALETASDDWMADVDGDGKADVALGRLPAGTEAEARAMVAKIVRHENSARSLEKALFVADTAVASNFAHENSKLRELVPASVSVATADADTLGDSATRAAILDSFARGVDLIHYSGHGTIDHWRGNLLTVADAPSLRNTERLPVVTVANCLTGIFQEPLMDGLGEALVAAPDAGAVAVWGSSGTTGVTGQDAMMAGFMKALFEDGGVRTVGEAVRKAKAAVKDPDVRRTWILLGDPATRIH